MKNESTIVIWEGCDPTLSQAIGKFSDRWRPYSIASRRYPIWRLIQELIDPAVTIYMRSLPVRYSGFVPGASTGVGFTAIIRLMGLDTMVRVQRQLLRQFIKTENTQNSRDQRFVATVESLIGLVWECAGKQPVKSPLRDSTGRARRLNGSRPQRLCRFCGAPTEITSFAADEFQECGKGDENKEKLRLSNLYCMDHRPLLPSGAWNPAYRQARRSVTQFDLELVRIKRQCAKPSVPRAASGDQLVDSYFFHYFFGQPLQLTDQAELRNLARRMVHSKLSDTKKRMLALQHSGLNQSEIARKLLDDRQQPLTRQAVSKALASIPIMFHLK
jgi:hypothetical protein